MKSKKNIKKKVMKLCDIVEEQEKNMFQQYKRKEKKNEE